MKRVLSLAVIALFLFVPEIVNAKKEPDWVMGQSNKYPSSRFFIGVGSYRMDKGSEKQSTNIASDKARAEISKIIKTEIESEVKETRVVTASKQGKKGSYKADSKQSELVLARSSEVLEGVEIKEYYKDKKNKTVYALAVLDRVKTANMLEQRVQKSQKSLLADIEEGKVAQNNNDYLTAIRHYDSAYLLAQKVTALSELVYIINPLATKADAGEYYYEAEIKIALLKLKKLIRPCLLIEGEAKKISDYVKSGLTNAGFSVVGTDSKECNYLISGDTSVTYRGEIDMGGKNMLMQIYEAGANLSVLDISSNKVLKAEVWMINANEKTHEMARMSAIRALGDMLKKQVANKLFGI